MESVVRIAYFFIQLLGIGIAAFPFIVKNSSGMRLYTGNEVIPWVVVGVVVALYGSILERKFVRQEKKKKK